MLFAAFFIVFKVMISAIFFLGQIDQLLTWVAYGTHDYPSQDVLMTMQALMETVRMSHPKVLKQLLEVVVGHAVVPGNAIGALKLYYVPINCAFIIFHFSIMLPSRPTALLSHATLNE